MIGRRRAVTGGRNSGAVASHRYAAVAVLAMAGLAAAPNPALAQREPVSGATLSGPGLAAAVSGTPATGLGNDVPQGSPIPRILPPVLPGAAPGAAVTAPVAPAPVADVTQPIRAVTVAGATAYPAAELERLTAGLTGPAVSQRRIEAARTAIVNRYRSDGYVFTAVSAFVADGALRFVVTEGHVTDVQLDGDIGPAAAQVLRFLNHVTATRPIDTATIERWLLLASDVPGISIRSVLRASNDDPGGLTLVAQVSRTPVNGLVTADNRGFRQAGPGGDAGRRGSEQLHRGRRAHRVVDLPHLQRHPDLRPGLDRAVPRQFRITPEGVWRRRRHHPVRRVPPARL